MMMRLIALTSVFLVSFPSAYAEEVMLENEFSGLIEFGGDSSSGNSNNSAFASKLELGHSYGEWSNQFRFDASQKKDSGSLTEDKYNTIFKAIYELPKHLYTFVRLGYRQDSFSGVYWEKTYIGGFGYRAFTDSPEYKLDVEVGYGQRDTRKLENGVIRAKLDVDRGTHIALITQYNFTDEDVLKASVTAELGNDDDYIQTEISWKHKLFADLHLDVSYESLTLSKPALTKVSTDTKIMYKLGYSF